MISRIANEAIRSPTTTSAIGPGRFLTGWANTGCAGWAVAVATDFGADSGVCATWMARGVSAAAGATVEAGDADGARGFWALVVVPVAASAAAFFAASSATRASACACLPTGFAPAAAAPGLRLGGVFAAGRGVTGLRVAGFDAAGFFASGLLASG